MDELPVLALVQICSFINADCDLAAMAGTCKQWRRVSHEEAVYKPRCEAYGVNTLQGWGESFKFREMWTRLISRWGRLLKEPNSNHPTTWIALTAPFGGLVKARLEPGAGIVLYSVITWSLKGPAYGRCLLKIEPKLPLPGPQSESLRLSPDTPDDIQHSHTGNTPHDSSGAAQCTNNLNDPNSDGAGSSHPTGPEPHQCHCISVGLRDPQGLKGSEDLVRGHDATADLIQMNDGSLYFRYCCCKGCKPHTQVDPLLRHAGNVSGLLSQVPVLVNLSIPALEIHSGVLSIPEMDERHLHMNLASHIIGSQQFFEQENAMQYGAGLSLFGSFPDQKDPDETMYSQLKVGQGHALAGLWRGTFGPHGMEIINITVNSDNTKLVGLKVTGDLNVPAGQISFEIQTSTHPNPSSAQGEFFRLPPHFHTSVKASDLGQLLVKDVHEGLGHIARTGFRGDSWTEQEVVVFGPDCFGILWIDLQSLSIFTRLNLDCD